MFKQHKTEHKIISKELVVEYNSNEDDKSDDSESKTRFNKPFKYKTQELPRINQNIYDLPLLFGTGFSEDNINKHRRLLYGMKIRVIDEKECEDVGVSEIPSESSYQASQDSDESLHTEKR